MADLDEAIDRVIGGLERKSRVLSEKERDIVAHHEIGHALVASSLPHADPVHKVTIIPRGVGALGATYQLPLEDRYLLTRSELEDRIAVLLGGRAAEEIGVRGDLDRRPQRPRAGDGDGAADGDAVRDVRQARPDDLRRGPAGPVSQGLGPAAGEGVQRRHRPGHRRRDPGHHRPDVRPRARPHDRAEGGADVGGGGAEADAKPSRATGCGSCWPGSPWRACDDLVAAHHPRLPRPGRVGVRRRARQLGRRGGGFRQIPAAAADRIAGAGHPRRAADPVGQLRPGRRDRRARGHQHQHRDPRRRRRPDPGRGVLRRRVLPPVLRRRARARAAAAAEPRLGRHRGHLRHRADQRARGGAGHRHRSGHL